ncbi:MAG TPA: DUF433 domain-containing protein [Verrucomicrobiales bacterium]|nr:DUF433 domain-containing protein [Verrucomicrobiales bacterium]
MTIAESSPHVRCDASGTAWIDDTGVKVIQVAMDHLAHGWSADTIHENHPHLSLAQIHAALAWFYDHQNEMERLIRISISEAEERCEDASINPVQRRLRMLKAAAAS